MKVALPPVYSGSKCQELRDTESLSTGNGSHQEMHVNSF